MANMRTMLVALAICFVAVMAVAANDEQQPEMRLPMSLPGGEWSKRAPYKPFNPCKHVEIKNGDQREASEKACYKCCADEGGMHWYISLFGLNTRCHCAFGPM